MIAPLRRRHRSMMAGLLLCLALAAALALARPAPSALIDTLPTALVGGDMPGGVR